MQHQAAPKNISIQIQKEKLATLLSCYECTAKYNFDSKTCLILLYMIEFLKAIIFFLDSNNIKYMLSGSIALGAYTLPRATRDFDFIVQIKKTDADIFANRFNAGYYCNKDSITDAVQHEGMFNIIDHASGFKADFVVLKDSAYRKNEFERRIQIELFNMKVFIVSPEDLLISKLIWIQDFQSNLQIDDIKSLIKFKSLDIVYVHFWIEKLKLNTFTLI